MTSPAPGQPAPDFALPDQDGKEHRLSDLRGRWVLLYFYPKDDTPGCTTQACGLRDSAARYAEAGCVVLGLSPDSVASHRKFADKHGLPFTLLADTEKAAAQAYGTWREKSFMGRIGFGIVRSSFLVDPQGNVAKVYPKVSPAEHADMVLADLAALSPR